MVVSFGTVIGGHIGGGVIGGCVSLVVVSLVGHIGGAFDRTTETESHSFE